MSLSWQCLFGLGKLEFVAQTRNLNFSHRCVGILFFTKSLDATSAFFFQIDFYFVFLKKKACFLVG